MYKIFIMYWHREENGTIILKSYESSVKVYNTICSEALSSENDIMQVDIFNTEENRIINSCKF